jgi:hypothetical protein
MISSLKLQASMVAGSVILYLLVSVANELLFNSAYFEVVRGMSWIYLPAGMRLLCTLLFGGAGAIGVWIASWLVGIFYFFPNDPLRSFVGGIASAAAPYLVYKMAQRLYGLQASLANLDSRRLLVLILAYSIASPSLHHLWFFLHGEAITYAYFVMVTGDLLGTLFIIYSVKFFLALFPVPGQSPKNRQPSA